MPDSGLVKMRYNVELLNDEWSLVLIGEIFDDPENDVDGRMTRHYMENLAAVSANLFKASVWLLNFKTMIENRDFFANVDEKWVAY